MGALQTEALVAPDVADLIWNRDLAGGIDGIVARWTGGDGRIVAPVNPPDGVAVLVLADLAVGQLGDEIDLTDLFDHDPPVVLHVRIATDAASAFPEAPPERVIDLTAPNRAPETFTAPAPASGDWFVALGQRDAARLATGDPDGTLGQSARLARVLDAFAGLGAGQVVVGTAGAGQAARLAAAAAPSVSDVVTLGTPYGPVSLTVLDEAAAGDAWRLLQDLVPDDTGDDDADLARGRALVAALAEVDDSTDPAVELRVPAGGVPTRGDLSVHAVFGAVTEPAVRRSITAIVAAGLAARAQARAAADTPGPPTGARLALRATIEAAPTDRIVVAGDVTIDVGGLDVASSGEPAARVTVATDHGVRARLRIGARDGWLAGGPDPLRGPTRSREHALRAVSVDVTVPRGTGSTATASARITLLDGRVFDVRRDRWDAVAGGEPVAAEVRLLLSLAAQRIATEAIATVASPAAAGLRAVVEALELLTADGSVADAVEQLLHDPGTLVGQALADAARRAQLATGAQALLGGAATGGDPGTVRLVAGPATVVVDLAARSVTLEAPSGQGRFGWSAHLGLTTGGKDWSVRLGADTDASPAGAAWLQLGPGQASLHWHPAGSAPQDVALFPRLDAAAAVGVLLKLTPALLGASALEVLRSADETAQPVIDVALGAFGLLDGTTPEARVRLPLGLVHDPAGWLRHAGALAGQPARLVALVDAVKPLLGLSGDPGVLQIAAGVALSAHDNGGALELQAVVDTTAFTTPATTPLGRLVAGLAAGVVIPGAGPPHLTLDVHLGLDGAGAGRKAVHVNLAGSLTVFLRPATGADVVVYPAGPGLAAAAAAGAVDAASHALPFLLDTLAGQSGATLAGTVGAVVAAVGDALGLRDAAGHFTYDRLTAFAADPVGGLEHASTTIVVGALPNLTAALDAAMPAGVVVAVDGQVLQVTAGPVVLRWQPSPFRVDVTAVAGGLPAVDTVALSIALTAAGLDALDASIGPAPIPVGPIELRPVLAVHAGAAPVGGRRVELGLDLDGTHRVAAQWLLDAHTVQLAVLGDTAPVTDPAAVATALAEVVTTLAASIALATDEVEHLLAVPVGSTTVDALLHGVLLQGDGTLDPTVFAPAGLLVRLAQLLDNLAGAGLAVTIDGTLTVGIGKDGSGVVGVTLGLAQRLALVSSDIMVWLEADDSWIDPVPTVAGITVAVVKLDGDTVSFVPGVTVAGLGIRVGRASGPLLDLGLTLESVAVHAFAALSATEQGAGVQLQFTNLAVAVSGASGGNPIASGILADSGSAGQKPKPSFSPALAVQKHGADPVEVTLRAGDGDGPWWIAIQKGFGPLYLDKVGFGVTMPQHKVDSISLLLDARVSLFGLSAAVDDLSITYFVAKGDFFTADNWAVDLGGLAVSAEIGPLSISGGLLKNGSGDNVEYLGMLMGRFGVYGLTIYGGYGKTDGVVSFFAIGAVVGPIGGVPAFFVTGIGGGFGINRALVVPTDLSQFATYPLIKALDVSASAAPDPMQELRQLGVFFPPEAGTFWFAAGLSFTSFALVDGIAVVAVELGNGVEFALLGLARMALPRPQFAIVSIELALVVRVSTKEGVIWVQGQLTDNSYLLYKEVRLTGGFAYVSWFSGPHSGELVLTIGGYHPDFHRDGYPEVPRLGLQWRVGPIVVKGGAYFALTSEAVMAGVDVEVSADFGCAWARLSFGAHGIVFFDPFHYRVDAYARIAAGITIDTWFGDITFSVSLGATITVEGPDFHGKATIEVGPCDVSVPFGSTADHTTPKLTAAQFIPKYLEEVSSGVAQAISSIVSAGAVPPRPGQNGATPQPPDGTSDRPFVVTAEFALTITTTVPAIRVDAGGAVQAFDPTHLIGIAPMGVAAVEPVLTLRWHRGAAEVPWPFGAATPRQYGAFPLGVWGPPQSADAPKVPTGEVVKALNQVGIAAGADVSVGGPAIDYNRVDPPGPRRPLPFLRNSGAARQSEVQAGRDLRRPRGRGRGRCGRDRAGRRLAAPGRCLAARAGVLGGRAPHGGAAARIAGRPPGPPRRQRGAGRGRSCRAPGGRPDGAGPRRAGGARHRHAAGGHAGVQPNVGLGPAERRPGGAAHDRRAAQRAGRGPVGAVGRVRAGRQQDGGAHGPAVGDACRTIGRRQCGDAGRRRPRSPGWHHRRARRREQGRRVHARARLPGEVVVLALPNARRDVSIDAPRPRLVVKGTPTRVRDAAPRRRGGARRGRQRRRPPAAPRRRADRHRPARRWRRRGDPRRLARRHDPAVHRLGHGPRRGGHGPGGGGAPDPAAGPLPGRLGRGRRAGRWHRHRDHPLHPCGDGDRGGDR